MKDKVKFYNKEISKQENNIELTIILICAFLIGFIAGYLCINSAVEEQQKMQNNIIKIKEE